MSDVSLSVRLQSKLSDVAEDILLRLRYLEPDLSFDLDGDVVIVAGSKLSERETAIRHLIDQVSYQQLVYHDTLPIRERIYNA